MKKKQPKQAFTLIELLTVIAIIGILASILIPTVGRVREAARRTVDASNIRQIGQGALIYANDNREALPPRNLGANGLPEGQATANTTTVIRFAAALAQSGGINDGNIWKSSSDTNSNAQFQAYRGGTILNADKSQVQSDFNNLGALSFAVIGGLRTSNPSTTPIAFTRGLKTDGLWDTNKNNSVYGKDGGHIVFIGGNVAFYKDTIGTGTTDGIFVKRVDGEPTKNVLDTISTSQTVYTLPASTGASGNGTGGA